MGFESGPANAGKPGYDSSGNIITDTRNPGYDGDAFMSWDWATRSGGRTPAERQQFSYDGEDPLQAGREQLAAVAQGSLSVSLEDQIAAAKEMAEYNLSQFPTITQTAVGAATRDASLLDQQMADRFYSGIENLMPNYRETFVGNPNQDLDAVRGIANQLMSGELPQDVKDAIQRYRAELGVSQGLFGEAAGYATARDLGKTSYDLMMQGVNLQSNAVSPLTARLMSNVMALQAPVTDLAAMSQNYVGILSGQGSVSPGTTLQAASQVGLANAQLSWDAQLSQFNASMDVYQTQLQQQMQRDQISAARTNAIIGAGAGLAGTAGALAILSDARLKTIIAPVGEVGGVNLYLYEYNNPVENGLPSGVFVGVIAQELQKVYPEYVHKFGDTDYLAVDYHGLYGRLKEEV